MKLTWYDVSHLNIPAWKVVSGAVALVALSWAAFVWADDVEDKQLKTQDQLDQLILIVSASSTNNQTTHEIQDEDIDTLERMFALLKQEAELRRELGNADGN